MTPIIGVCSLTCYDFAIMSRCAPGCNRHSGGGIVDRDRDTAVTANINPAWTAKKTNEFLQAHIRPPSVTLIRCVARAHCPFLHLQVKSLSISHPVLHTAPGCLRAGVPTTLQTRKLTESPMCPVLHRTANTVSLTAVLPIDLLGCRPSRPYVIVIRLSSSSPGVFTSSAPALSDSSHGHAPLHSSTRGLVLMNTSCRSQFATL